MRGFYYLFSATIMVVSFQACDQPSHEQRGTFTELNLSAELPPGTSVNADPVLQSQALGILQAKCASCHQTGASGGVTQILNVNHLLASGLIVAGDPSQGAIMDSITAGRMPLNGSVTAGEIQTLRDWISSITVTGPLPAPAPAVSPLPAGKTVAVDSALHTQAMTVLNTYCAGCHQGANSGGINNILDVRNLVRSGLVTAGNPNVGRLVGAIMDGSMPQGNGARVPAADLTVLRNWIASIQIVDDVGQAAPPTRVALSPTFSGVFANVIQPKCVACHGPNRSYGGKRYDTYAAINGDIGDIREEVESGGMPRTPYPALTPAELSTLQAWIAAGRPNN